MKRIREGLGLWWLPVMGLSVSGLMLVILMTPAGAVVAAPQAQPDFKVYYDPPQRGSEAPSDYVVGARWEKSPVTYSFTNCPRSLACDVAQQQVREAIEAWDAVCGLTLDEIAADGDIRIGWFSGDHGDGNPFDGPGDVLAHAFFPLPFLGDLGGDIHLDNSETWVVDAPTEQRQVHLKTTAMHETGHALGLDHSLEPSALMWAEYTGVRSIGPDDTAGVQALYGPPSPDEGGTVASPAAPQGVMAIATTTVRVRSGPGTDFAQVGSVDAGVAVPVLGKNTASDWLYIDSNGLRGWAAAFLFTVQGDLNTVPVVDQNGNGAATPLPPAGTPVVPPAQPTTSPPANPGAVTGTAISTVRVRTGPGTNYAPVGAIDAGTTVELVARTPSSSWVYVEYQGTQGWAATWLFTVHGDVNSLPVMQPIF